MKLKLKQIIVLLLVIFSGIFYYQLTEPKAEIVQTSLIRAIDGDTIDTDLGRVRLLAINTPEKEQPFYQEAKNFLGQYENKTISLELKGKDKYDRWLGYLFYNGELINEKILEMGLANLYVYDKDKYFTRFENAEKRAIDSGIGLWKKSNNSDCLQLVKLDYIDGGKCDNQEQMILNNLCQYNLNVIIKDDANHIYDENISPGRWQKNFSCIWNDVGDTIHIRDENGLMLFWRY